MSTNAYWSEQTIRWATTPGTYFGWHVSTSGSSHELHPFDSAEQQASFVSAIRKVLPKHERDRADFYAALAALDTLGNEYEREMGFLQHHAAPFDEAVYDAAQAWIEKHL
jgi:hypothetical protein